MQDGRNFVGARFGRASLLLCGVLLLAAPWHAGPGRAAEVPVPALHALGQLSFTGLAGAVEYRVQWSPAQAECWTNWSALAAHAEALEPSGTRTGRTPWPMHYRVLAVTGSKSRRTVRRVAGAERRVQTSDSNASPRILAFTAGPDLAFQEITNAIAYHLEWTPALGHAWSNLAALSSLDAVPPAGTNVIRVCIPAFFRVRGEIMSAGASPSQYWHLPDAYGTNGPSRPPYARAALPAGDILFQPGVGYSVSNAAGDILYRYRAATGLPWQVVRADLSEPRMTVLTNLPAQRLDRSFFRMDANSTNGWQVFDLDAVLNGTDGEPAYTGLPGTVPELSRNPVLSEGGLWGFYTTWKHQCVPPLAEEFVPYDDPLCGKATRVAPAVTRVATNGAWARNASNETRYAFLRKPLLTIPAGATYVDLADELDFGVGDIRGQADQDITLYLRQPDGVRVLVYDDRTAGTNGFGSATGSGGAPGGMLAVSAGLFDLSGAYYMEVYASSGICSPPTPLPYDQDFEAYPNTELTTGAAVGWENWLLGGGTWELTDYNDAAPSPLGAPTSCAQRVLAQTAEGAAYAIYGDEDAMNYAVELTLGKAQTDNDEIRSWIRLNGRSGASPATGSGYFLFLNAGGGPLLGPDRDTNAPCDTIGLARWLGGGSATTVVSNLRSPIPGVSVAVSGGTGNARDDLQAWFTATNPRTGQANGFTVTNGNAECHRVRLECRGSNLTVYVSPHMAAADDPLNPAHGLNATNLGLQGGKTLCFTVSDPVYLGPGGTLERGCFAVQCISQVAWFDQLAVSPLQLPGGRGLVVDGGSTGWVEFVRAQDVATVSRYEVRDSGGGQYVIVDRFGGGYHGSASPPQRSNANGLSWNDPATPWTDESADNFAFKDYRPDMSAGAGIAVSALTSLPVLSP